MQEMSQGASTIGAGQKARSPPKFLHKGEDRGKMCKGIDTADGGCWGARYTLCLLLFLGITLIYMTRVCLSIAIVAMAGTSVGANNSSTNICPYPAGWNDTVGEAQGVTFPTIHMMMATWIPPRDRARIGTMVFSGVMIGTVVAMS
ncbi:probable anion transporter 6, partial [Penaeus monodon]|uniref:probable anion transporter 6 n=1 Tax=Penaeus monodon TaxID=6687 RepID=UPI0018A767B3